MKVRHSSIRMLCCPYMNMLKPSPSLMNFGIQMESPRAYEMQNAVFSNEKLKHFIKKVNNKVPRKTL